MCIGCIHTWIRFGAIRIECVLNQSISGGGLEPYRNGICCLFIKKQWNHAQLHPSRTAALSKPLKIWTKMAYHAGMLLTKCCQKWDRLPSGLHRNSCSTSSTTSNKARQILGQTLCVFRFILNVGSIKPGWKLLLELQWVQHANSNSVTVQFLIWQCERVWHGFNLHSMHIGWMWIQFAFKYEKALTNYKNVSTQ